MGVGAVRALVWSAAARGSAWRQPVGLLVRCDHGAARRSLLCGRGEWGTAIASAVTSTAFTAAVAATISAAAIATPVTASIASAVASTTYSSAAIAPAVPTSTAATGPFSAGI